MRWHPLARDVCRLVDAYAAPEYANDIHGHGWYIFGEFIPGALYVSVRPNFHQLAITGTIAVTSVICSGMSSEVEQLWCQPRAPGQTAPTLKLMQDWSIEGSLPDLAPLLEPGWMPTPKPPEPAINQ